MAESVERDRDSEQSESGRMTWWHLALGLGFVMILMLLAPRGKSLEFAHLSIGSISPAKIIAPFDFEILKDNDELAVERSKAAEAIPLLFVRVDTVETAAKANMTNFGLEVDALLASLPLAWLTIVSDSSSNWDEKEAEPFLRGSRAISDKYGLHLNWEQWSFLFRLYISSNDHRAYGEFFSKIGPWALSEIYRLGVAEPPPDDEGFAARSASIQSGNIESEVPFDSLVVHGRKSTRLDGLLLNRIDIKSDSLAPFLASSILSQFVIPNLIYDREETERRRRTAINGVPLAQGFVKQDELIIDRHIKVTEDHLARLNSLAIKRAELSADRGGFKSVLPVFGQTILIAMLTAFMMFAVRLARPDVWGSWQRLLLLFLVMAAVLTFFKLVPIRFGLSRQLLPAAFAGLLLTILLGKSIAGLGVVTIALAAGFLQGNDFQTSTYALANGGVAILALRSLQARRDVIWTSLYLAVVSLVMVFAFYLATYTSDTSFWEEAGLAASIALLSPMLVLGVAPLIESLFGITTDLTLLELLDLNRPLLRQLALKSPGTYHHSLMVGSLAEAGARAIGANSLLTRAGAYYHDIGKMDIREYFIENQETGSENIHDRLPPSESARIVIEHVQRGMELAEQHNLPPEIKMFITEHHGKTKLAYFYSKAQREQGKRIDEKQFRYSGPKPQTRETAILMLADGVEAATRSLDHPSHADLVEMVDKFVTVRLMEGDLEECPLSLREITRIKDAFLTVLFGIHHQRIQYPDSSQSPEKSAELQDGTTISVVN